MKEPDFTLGDIFISRLKGYTYKSVGTKKVKFTKEYIERKTGLRKDFVYTKRVDNQIDKDCPIVQFSISFLIIILCFIIFFMIMKKEK